MTYLRDIQRQKARSEGSGREMGLFDIHHVEEHEACVVVFFFLGEWLETVLFVERNGREVGIDSDETECGTTKLGVQQSFYSIHKPCAYTLTSIVQRDSKPTNLNTRIAAKLLTYREVGFNLLPSAPRYLIAANAVIEQAEISGNTSIVFKDERIGNAQRLGVFRIIEKKSVQVAVTAIKIANLIIRSQSNQFHNSPTDFNVFACFSDSLLKLPSLLGTLLGSPVLHHQSLPFKVEGIFALQYRRFFNRSCHNQYTFIGSTVQKYK